MVPSFRLHFAVRDLFWATAVLALIVALLIEHFRREEAEKFPMGLRHAIERVNAFETFETGEAVVGKAHITWRVGRFPEAAPVDPTPDPDVLP